MNERTLRFYSHLQQMSGGSVNYLFLGDLNTMGMNLTYSDGDMNAARYGYLEAHFLKK